MGLDLECLEQSALVMLNHAAALIGSEQVVSDACLQDNVLVEELDLIPEVLLDDISKHLHVGEGAAFFQNDLHLSGGQAGVIDAL